MPLGAFLIAKPFQLAALCLDMRIGKSLPCRFALARASATPSARGEIRALSDVRPTCLC
jgi:hypothetical protein